MADSGELGAIFKAYDVRGVVPTELDARRAFAIGAGFARFAAESDDARRIAVAHDMRTSGTILAGSFTAGAESEGAEVVLVGLASTDLLYFVSGVLQVPGAMLTASHNPPQYNGVKFCRAGTKPVGQETGLGAIRRYAEEKLATLGAALPAPLATADGRDWPGEFARHVRSFIDCPRLLPLKVAADAGNGMGGLITPHVFEGLPCTLDLLYGELDGTFPHHPANPIEPANLVDLRQRILATAADVGLAFDGDADRVFLVDELGEPLSGSTTTAIVARAMLAKHRRDGPIQRDLLEDRRRGDRRVRRGGDPHTGRALVHQGPDGRDGGRLRGRALRPLLLPGELRGGLGDHRRPRRARGAQCRGGAAVGAAAAVRALRRFRRAEHPVGDTAAVIASVAAHYAALGRPVDELDGLTVDSGDWWFNIRPSNTEPLLRLNVEAADAGSCAAHVTEVRELIGQAEKGGGGR